MSGKKSAARLRKGHVPRGDCERRLPWICVLADEETAGDAKEELDIPHLK
jgi:hypothetical protein